MKYNDESGELFGFVAKTLIFNAVKDLSVNIVSKTFQSGKSWSWNSTRNAWKITEGFGKGTAKQRLSRFTWEAPQTLLGYSTSQLYNGVNGVNGVRGVTFYGGATAVEGKHTTALGTGGAGITLGSYINMQSGHQADPNDWLFQHEYGHYLQSQSSGWSFLSKYGIPSFFSTGEHGDHPVEQDANARGLGYFVSQYGVGFASRQNNIGWDHFENQILGYDRNLDYEKDIFSFSYHLYSYFSLLPNQGNQPEFLEKERRY